MLFGWASDKLKADGGPNEPWLVDEALDVVAIA